MPYSRERMNEYMRQRHIMVRAEAFARLGGKCAECGTTEGLEIDHVDRTSKTRSTGHFARMSRANFETELAKCQLLCGAHHKAKTVREMGWRTGHGSCHWYNRGCRCSVCRAGEAEYRRALRSR